MSRFIFSPSSWITNVPGSNLISKLSILITFVALYSVPPSTPYRAMARIFLPHLQIIICNSLSLSNMLHNLRGRSQWPRGPRHRSAVARLLEISVRIPPRGMDVYLLWVLCVERESSLRWSDHSSRGIRLWCTLMRDLETWILWRP
jgi:hypothetical protein